MTSLTRAQELLRRWREAAGKDSSVFEWRYSNCVWYVELLWDERQIECESADPLTAVREAIKQTPWASVAVDDPWHCEPCTEDEAIEEGRHPWTVDELLGRMDDEDDLTDVDTLRGAIGKERAQHAFDLEERDARLIERNLTIAERDARIAELTQQLAIEAGCTFAEIENNFRYGYGDAPLTVQVNAKLRKERNAAREQYRGLRAAESTARHIIAALDGGELPAGNSHVEEAIKRRVREVEKQRDNARESALKRLAEAFEHWDGSKVWPFNPGLFWRPNRHIRAARLLRYWATKPLDRFPAIEETEE